MGRTPAPSNLIAKAEELRKSNHTIADACRIAGVSPSTYYRHKSKDDASSFPALQRDWRSLAHAYKPGIKPLKLLDLRNLRRDTAQVFEQTFGREGWTRTGRQLAGELEGFRRAADEVIASFDELSSHARSWLDGLVEMRVTRIQGPALAAINRLRGYKAELPYLIKDLKDADRLNNRGRGGRMADPRLTALVTALADLFAKYSRQVPSHTVDGTYDRPRFVSRFNRFVLTAVRHFLKGHQIKKTALREAMRHAAARIDWTYVAAGSDDPAFSK